VFGERSSALVALEASNGWTISRESDTEVAGSSAVLVPFGGAQAMASPAMHELEIVVHAPRGSVTDGELSITLSEGPNETPVETSFVPLRSVIPDSWTLSCSTETPVSPAGASVTVGCVIPEEAWNARAEGAYYTVSVPDGASGDRVSLRDNQVSYTYELPCSASGSVLSFVEVVLGEGIYFSSETTVFVEGVVASSASDLEVSTGGSAIATWTGDGYTPAETIVTVRVSEPADGCVPARWKLEATFSTFTNGKLDIELPVVYSGVQSSTENITMSNSEVLIPGSAVAIAHGVGGGVIVLKFEVTLPEFAPTSTYLGSVTFDLSSEP
jgi:hypothetical protein